jgi:hypothetical protein
MSTKIKIIVSLLIAGAFVIGVAVALTSVITALKQIEPQFAPLGSQATPKCSVSSTEVASIGHQLSSTILSANETRAYARIQTMPNATNTSTFSFDEGAAAVINEGASITGAGTTTTQFIEFGRATHFPYTGAVTGINSTGSSTVLVTECSY